MKNSSLKWALSDMKENSFDTAVIKLAVLEKFYTNYSSFKTEIESFLYQQFNDCPVALKKIIFTKIKSLDISSIESNSYKINTVKMLNSPYYEVQQLCLKFIHHFFRFYEYDEVVIFSIRKYNMFKKLIYNSKRYRYLFNIQCKKSEISEESTGNTSNAVTDTNFQLNTTGNLLLLDLDLCDTLLVLKEKLIGKLHKNLNIDQKIIAKYFIKIINISMFKNNTGIPGLHFDLASERLTEIDPELQLNIHGLEGTEEYNYIINIINKLLNYD
ncbi:hypothetical protein NUSPORA_02015 [Nucleospora cyclopteri]